MENIFVEFLPPWVETGLQPAFYDKESGTVLQQTARMYDRVNMLVRMFNKLSKETKNVVEEYIGKFNELHDYVYDYFDNLDVQEEIDHKLDEMADDGTLADIIADYIQLKGVLAYSTVASMKSATNLVNGSFAETYGYHTAGDGGSMKYKIREVINTDTIDEMKLIALADEDLVAEAIIPEVINPEMFGAYGDGTHNDHDALVCAFDLDNTIVCTSGKTYLSNTGITITKRKNINFGLSTIKFTNNSVGLTIDMSTESVNKHEQFAPVIEKLCLDGYDTTKVMYVDNAYKATIKDIYINNFRNVGLEKNRGYELVFDNLYFWASNQNTSSIGLLVTGNDCEYGNIFGINCHTGVKMIGGGNHFKNIHMWLFKDDRGEGMLDGDALYQGSAMIEIAGGGRYYIDHAYFDSYQYGFKYSHYGRVFLNSGIMYCPSLTITPDYLNYTIYFIYADNDHLPYLHRFVINNFEYQVESGNTVTAKMIPEGYADKPIRITNSTIPYANDNLRKDYIGDFQFLNCSNVNIKAVPVGENKLLIRGLLQKDNTNDAWVIKKNNASYEAIITNEVRISHKSSDEYFSSSPTVYRYNVGNNIGELGTTSANYYYEVDCMLNINYY